MVKNLSVLQAKRYGLYSCNLNTTLLAAAEQMVQRNISALVVVNDGGDLRGIISRTDLVRACKQSVHWPDEPVSRYMSGDVVTVAPDTLLDEVMELLLDKQIHRVVVVREADGHSRPVAVLSAADLLYHMVNEIE